MKNIQINIARINTAVKLFQFHLQFL